VKALHFSVHDYDLRKTLESGQTFHWDQVSEDSWEGMIAGRWIRLSQFRPDRITAQGVHGIGEVKEEIVQFLQLDVDIRSVIKGFPDDPLMRAAVQARTGLRLLRQDPWVCLASFLLSSNKRIPQIMEIVRHLSKRLGALVEHPDSGLTLHAFPGPESIAASSETLLRECKAGYRAKYLYQSASLIASGAFCLDAIHDLELDEARAKLTELPGVGTKIADCVLLFAYGFSRAFPVDVWVYRVLSDYYLKGRKTSPRALGMWVQDYFGEQAGFAQQYLFDYIRHLKPVEWNEWVTLGRPG
jgi:N-glycosylase/DNA lyase